MKRKFIIVNFRKRKKQTNKTNKLRIIVYFHRRCYRLPSKEGI